MVRLDVQFEVLVQLVRLEEPDHCLSVCSVSCKAPPPPPVTKVILMLRRLSWLRLNQKLPTKADLGLVRNRHAKKRSRVVKLSLHVRVQKALESVGVRDITEPCNPSRPPQKT
jgi:hypothetical protein